ncbi:MAG: hypothetical protein J5883_09105 [Clostridiales bacterium]|nr:hypothetical protein [Clostridiales bacterium]
MENLFYENIVKRDNGRLGKLFSVVTVIALVIFIIFFTLIPMLFGYNIIFVTGMLSFGLSYLIYRLIKNQNKEYELSIVNDQFTITRITNGKKRDLLVDTSIRDCEYIGPVTSDRYNDDLQNSSYCLNCTDVREPAGEDYWYLFCGESSYKYMVKFNYEEEMYELFRRYNIRRTYRIT